MIAQSQLLVRPAQADDQQKLAFLIHFELHVHRHLDYRPPLDWVGTQPFYILEDEQGVHAALACPPAPPEVAWIRLFASANHYPYERAWEALWPHVYADLLTDGQVHTVAAIPLQSWFENLLQKNGFQPTHSIVMLRWDRDTVYIPHAPRSPIKLRPMSVEDLAVVAEVDAAAFTPVWRNSQRCLGYAYQQAVLATVAEMDGQVIGYQISTPTPMGGHLARLAVHPNYQGFGIGQALLADTLLQFRQRGAQAVTVNTQKNNHSSLALYQRAGFKLTGEELPIYEMDLPTAK